jgi:alkanesulfonate monooxygenase SsuD/methylene tetrahydromethanopterin reductase-like flavin-dependent oxidoreductase (luciferase family)
LAQKKVEFGLTLPNRGVVVGGIQAREVVDLAVKAEETGVLTTVWAGDSILGKPRLECITLLSAIAARTSRVRLGVACMSTIVQRNPVLFGLQWASLDALSEGRTELAACMGQPASQGPGNAKELEVMGIASKERPGRLVEMVAALRELWSSEHATFHGKYYRFDDVNLLPKPVQQPCPIWIAATPRPQNLGEKGVERVLRRIALNGDGWQTILITPEMFRDYLTRIRKIREAEGLDNAGFKTSLYYDLNVGPDRETAYQESKEYLDEYYATDFSRDFVELSTAHGTVEQCLESIQSYIDAGVDHITMRLASRDHQARQFDLYLNEVLPALGIQAG